MVPKKSTLRAVWSAVKKAGRARELDEALRAAARRLVLSDAQLARIAA